MFSAYAFKHNFHYNKRLEPDLTFGKPFMTRFLLIRHATNDFVKTGRLAGWTPNVHLNEEGQKQALALGERLKEVPLAAIYSSPLERTMETAQAIAQYHTNLAIQPEPGIGEVGYGKWQGQKLSVLARYKKWYNIQNYPSRVHFPEGESIRGAQARAVDTLERLYQQHRESTVVCVGHSDVIKMTVAHYLGMHLDFFQRIEISPASITVLTLGASRPTIEVVNDTSHLPPPPKKS